MWLWLSPKYWHFKRFLTCNHSDTFVFLDLMGFDICRCLMRTWTVNGRVLPPAGHHKQLSNLYLFGSPWKNSGKTKQKKIFLTERLDETTSCVRYRILNEDFPLHTIMESSSVSQIRILKNFIETKIHFSPSPLWFSGKKGKETCFGF